MKPLNETTQDFVSYDLTLRADLGQGYHVRTTYLLVDGYYETEIVDPATVFGETRRTYTPEDATAAHHQAVKDVQAKVEGRA